VNARVSGACALAVLLHGTRIWCAGAGDCRAVIGAVNDAGDSVAIRFAPLALLRTRTLRARDA